MPREESLDIVCDSCAHKEVCAYKNDYLSVVNVLKEAFFKAVDDQKCSNITFVSPRCAFLNVRDNSRRY